LGSLHTVAQPVFEDLNKLSKAIEESSKSNIKSTEDPSTSSPCGQDDCEDAIYIGNQNTPGTTVPSETYSSEIILHSDGTVDDTSTVDYKSNYVRLDIGFSTEVGADFSAEIEACVEGTVDNGQGGDDPNCPDVLYVGDQNTPGTTIPSSVYAAQTTLESDGIVAAPDNVEQKAGTRVSLLPGFSVQAGAVYRGYIEDCSGNSGSTYYVNDASQLGDIYTTAIGSDATGTGTSSKPYATLKYVIENVNPPTGATIYVDAGVYDDTFITLNTPDLTIRGAGSLNTIFDNNYTDNDIEADDVSVGNLFMRVYADGTLLEGFTVREYNYHDLTADNVAWVDGKAITVSSANCVTFNNIHLTENLTDFNNIPHYTFAPLLIINSSVDILNSSLSYNGSTVDELEGGGVDIIAVDGNFGEKYVVNIENTAIVGNIRNTLLDGAIGGSGIGIFGIVDVNINNSEISNNISTRLGGGIYAAISNININNSCISNNSVVNQYESPAEGAGIYIFRASANIYNTVFDSNIAGGAHPSQGKGGAIYILDENDDSKSTLNTIVKLEQCKFENNQAAEGDHIYASQCRLDANDVQFFPETEAIFNFTDATLYIQNSGTPETSSTIDFINNDPPQNYATPLCASQTECIADAGFDQVICAGESVQIGTAPEDDRTYYWEPPTGLDDPYAATPTASPSETTTYTLYVGGCGRRSSEDEVTVYVSTGDISFPPDQVTCESTDILLTIGGGVEYQWTPAAGLSCTDCPNPVANVAQTTTYTVTVTDENGCEITQDITITVAGNLNVSISSDDQDGIICPGQQVQLTASGAMTYIWSSANGGLGNPNIPNPIVSPTATTTYTVTGFQDECYDTDQITLHVAPEYDVSINYNLVGCTIDFTAISSVPLNTYEWTIDGEVIEEGTNASTFGYGFTHNDTYDICLRVTGQCGEEVEVCESVVVDGCICTDSDLCITLAASANANYAQDASCQFSTIALQTIIGGGTPPFSSSWTGPNGFTSTLANPGIANATSINSGIYTLTVTDDNGCQTTSQTNYVQIDDYCVNNGTCYTIGESCDDGNPNTQDEVILSDCTCGTALSGCEDFTVELSSNTVCEGEVLYLTVNVTGSITPYSYYWIRPNGTPMGGLNPVLDPATTDYDGEWQFNAIGGTNCSLEETLIVTVNENPQASPTVIYGGLNGNACYFSGITLSGNASSGSSPYNYNWSGPNSFTSSFANPGIFNTTTANNGIYTLTVTDSNGCQTVEQLDVQQPDYCMYNGVCYLIGAPCNDDDPMTQNETIFINGNGDCDCGITF